MDNYAMASSAVNIHTSLNKFCTFVKTIREFELYGTR
jgi:hypothetical protein